jgi:voltage-gated potassium channel
MAGQRLAQTLVRPHVVQFLDFATSNIGPRIKLEQLRIDPGTRFVSRTVGTLANELGSGVIVLAIRRSDARMIFNPPAETAIEAGDFLIVLGEEPSLSNLENALL